MAGLGAAINTGDVSRGDSVAVIGCGGVGDAAIAGARLAGAATIIAVDLDDRKLEWAKGIGATHTVNASEPATSVEAIQALTGGNGADVVIDAVGRPETCKQAFYARDLAGTVVLVGVPTPEMTARAAAARRLRPRRLAEVLLVRRLPALARLPDAGRPATCRAASTWTRSSPRRSARRRRGGLRQDARRRGPALGGGALMAAAHRPPRHLRHLRASTAARGTSTTTSGSSATTTRSSSSTPPTTPPPILAAVGGRTVVAIV